MRGSWCGPCWRNNLLRGSAKFGRGRLSKALSPSAMDDRQSYHSLLRHIVKWTDCSCHPPQSSYFLLRNAAILSGQSTNNGKSRDLIRPFEALSEAATRSRDPNRRWMERKSPRSVSDGLAVGSLLSSSRTAHQREREKRSLPHCHHAAKIALCFHGRPNLDLSTSSDVFAGLL